MHTKVAPCNPICLTAVHVCSFVSSQVSYYLSSGWLCVIPDVSLPLTVWLCVIPSVLLLLTGVAS